MAEPTRFTELYADSFQCADIRGNVTGDVTGDVTGNVAGLLNAVHITAADSVSLSASQKVAVIGVTLSAASKTVTLGIPAGTSCIVINEGGTNAFTLKNIAGDAGTSIAAGKVALATAAATTAALTAYVLN